VAEREVGPMKLTSLGEDRVFAKSLTRQVQVGRDDHGGIRRRLR
jgi:hypothetical protein